MGKPDTSFREIITCYIHYLQQWRAININTHLDWTVGDFYIHATKSELPLIEK